MKKTINVFIKKTEELQEGMLTGGFASIKGGFASFSTSTTTNGKCDNQGDCSDSSNTINCTNGTSCDGASNTGPSCTNSGGGCFY